MLRHSSTLLGETNLFEEHFETVESAGYDLGLAAARLMGRKVNIVASVSTGEYVRRLLELELKNGIESKLVREVAEALAPAGEGRALVLLRQVMAGLTE